MKIEYDLFYSEIKNAWAKLSKEDTKGNPGKNPKDGAQRAHAIFLNTLESPLPFIVLGADRIRHQVEWKENFGLVTTQTKGAILGESPWSLLVNDAFILGAIQGCKEALLAAKQPPDIGNLWNPEEKKLSPLGRELALLQISGFKRVHTKPSFEGFAFKRKEPFVEFTLEALWKGLKEIKDPAILQKFIEEELCD